MKVELEVKGLSSIARRLKRLDVAAQKKVLTAATKAGAEVVADRMRARLGAMTMPYSRRGLRHAIAVQTKRRRKYEVNTWAGPDYKITRTGHFVEGGVAAHEQPRRLGRGGRHPGHTARPFVNESLADAEDAAQAAIAKTLWDALEDAANR